MSNAADPTGRIGRRVIYTGRVQGVGFRYTAKSIALRYPVSGYVKNLADGTVELEAHGRPEVVTEFLADVADRFDGNIADAEMCAIDYDPAHAGFGIRY